MLQAWTTSGSPVFLRRMSRNLRTTSYYKTGVAEMQHIMRVEAPCAELLRERQLLKLALEEEDEVFNVLV
jgi:hypothetical protein